MSGPIDGEDMARSGAGRSGTLLLYDWFKNITTLSLITLGGMLSILQAGDARVRPNVLAAMILLIALAGILGFDSQARLIKAELAEKPLPKVLEWSRRIAVWSYSVGVGMFLVLVVESVS